MKWTIYKNEDKPDQLPDRIRILISGFLSNLLTYNEEKELDCWVVATEANMELFGEWVKRAQADPSLSFIRKKDINQLVKKPVIPMPVLRAAIWFIVLVGVGVWKYYTPTRPFKGTVAGDKTNDRFAGSKNTLSTGSNKSY